ncbi:sensor histidine kinase [Bradyrhizobium sp. WD16]|uniref:sensor histidine kinase n=1 Tax=Bradyrhizobium sp. WD16 TaxID=1521768 RepID=UPI0020A49C94|nr:sensor histidine kinase [Bradyrhizobium sp. WD16]
MSLCNGWRGSLTTRSLALIAAAVVLGAAVLIAAAVYYARLAAGEAYDRILTLGVVQVAENLFVQGGVIAVDPPAATFASLSSFDLVFYKVVDPRGVVVAGHPDLPDAAKPANPNRGPVLSNGYYQGQDIRLATLGRHFAEAPGDGWATVTLAQTVSARDAFARELAIKAVMIVLAISALALLAGALAIRLALAPLARVERAIAARDPNNLDALDLESPVEIHALVNAVNQLMARLRQRMSMMQRFIADCAHQIRTPLAALDAQVELLTGEAARDGERITRIRQRSGELARLTNQLLGHAMVTHRANAGLPGTVDLVALARSALADTVPLTIEREVSIAFRAAADQVPIAGDAMSLREAIGNLVHNAITHGANSSLAVELQTIADEAVVQVIDDGSGIAAEDWPRMLEPFGTGPRGGSGLGLAIAADVVRAHGGTIGFQHRVDGRFAVVIRFPSVRPAGHTSG